MAVAAMQRAMCPARDWLAGVPEARPARGSRRGLQPALPVRPEVARQEWLLLRAEIETDQPYDFATVPVIHIEAPFWRWNGPRPLPARTPRRFFTNTAGGVGSSPDRCASGVSG